MCTFEPVFIVCDRQGQLCCDIRSITNAHVGHVTQLSAGHDIVMTSCCHDSCPSRCVAHLAETSHPELEVLVLPDMLRSALLTMVQVRQRNITG
jgi:hypothetical protein